MPPRRPRPLSRWAADGLVFLSSGAVLVLELSALRILAPYLGLTLETSTAVIGVALGAIAFGSWAGGRAADRVDPVLWLGPLLVVGGAATWAVLPLVRWAGEASRGGDQSIVLLLGLVVLFAPAAALAAVSPMVVRLQLRSLDRTGSVVGRLSAIGTLGALVATFGTGFVLFAFVPTSRILIALGAVLVAVGVVLVVRNPPRRSLAAATAAVVVVGLLALTAPNPCDVETRYHCASVRVEGADSSRRTLVLDRLRHSVVDVDDAAYLEFAYVRSMASVLDVVRPAGTAMRVLHLGAGGMTVPRYLEETRPGSTGTVLEIDAGVVAVVRERIAPEPPGLEVRVQDARIGLAEQADGAYDAVVGDAFGGLAVPWHLATREAAVEVSRVLRPDGVYVLNVIDQPPLALMRAEVATVADVFDHAALIATQPVADGVDGGNAVLGASMSPLALEAIAEQLSSRGLVVRVLAGDELAAFVGDARTLTDDLAPVDQLLTPWRSAEPG